MERVYNFLKEAGVYYLATVEGDQPRVRPFGTANIFEGKLYIQTGKIKPCSQQILANPKVEISAFTMESGSALPVNWQKMIVWKPRSPCWMPIPICGLCTMRTTAIPRYSILRMLWQPSLLLAEHPRL